MIIIALVYLIFRNYLLYKCFLNFHFLEYPLHHVFKQEEFLFIQELSHDELH